MDETSFLETDKNDIRLSLLSSRPSQEQLIEEDHYVSRIENASLDTNCQNKPNNVREFLGMHKKFYVYSCMTGIIWPESKDNATTSYTKHNMRYRIWSIYLHSMLLLSTILLILFGIYDLVVNKQGNEAILFCETIGIVLQNLILYPSIVYLRRELVTKRDIDIDIYNEAFSYSIQIGRRVFLMLMLFLLIYSIIAVNTTVSNAFTPLALFGVIMFTIALTPTQYFLSGLLTFLIVEQRLSMKTMEKLEFSAQKQSLTRHEYFTARESIDKRDKQTPINLLIFSAVVNSIVGVVLVFSLSAIHQGLTVIFIDIFYILTIFGKQFIILIVILLEIVKVNEKCDLMVKSISKHEWTESENTSFVCKKSSLVRSNLNLNDDAEKRRFSVYMACKEFPIGSTIFFIRPSKFQIMLHIVSMVVSVCAAIFWALAFK